MSYSNIDRLPFKNEFSEQDWPKFQTKHHPSVYNRARPYIVLHSSFQDYFRYSYENGSITAAYRQQFTLTVTLLHEVAHAYSYWLGWPKGMTWSIWEKKAELGNSWEYNVTGRVVQSLRHANAASYVLVDVRIEQFGTQEQRDRVASSLVRNRIAEYTKVKRKETDRRWPVLTPSGSQYWGSELYLDQTCDQYIAVLNAIPISWIMAWFQEDQWTRWRKQWERRGHI
jgi:hypothetical protein